MWTPLRGSGSVPLVAGLLAFAALASPAAQTPADSVERFTLEGDDVLVELPVGKLEVVPGSGSAVVIEVTRGGRDAGQLEIDTGEGTRPSLLVRYPVTDVVYPEMGRANTTTSTDMEGSRVRRRFTVRGSGRGILAWTDMRVMVPTGRKVEIHHTVGRTSIAGIDARLSLEQGWGDVVSRDTRGTLALDCGSGAVTIVDAAGEVSLDSGSGEVEVTNVRGTRLSLDTGSGGVSANAVQVGKLDASTGSGSVTLSNVKADMVALDSGSGRIEIDLATHARSVSIDTGSGGITLRLPRTFGAAFNIEKGSGGVDIDVPHEITRKSSDGVRGRIGDGRGEINIETGSGGVRITRRSASGTSWHIGPSALVGFATA